MDQKFQFADLALIRQFVGPELLQALPDFGVG